MCSSAGMQIATEADLAEGRPQSSHAEEPGRAKATARGERRGTDLGKLQHGPGQHGDGEGGGDGHLQRARLPAHHEAARHVAKAQIRGAPLLQRQPNDVKHLLTGATSTQLGIDT